MAIAEILVNGVAGSNDNITLNSEVMLSSSGSASTYLWAIVSQPSGTPNAVLSSETASAVTFMALKEGSYLVRLVVDAGLPGEAADQVIVAVRELQTGNRIPAAGETTENDATTGWANTAVDQILQRVTRFTDQGVIVGRAGAQGLLPLTVVYASDVVTIATGLPGQREVPLFERALATDARKVHGLIGVVLSGVDGSPTPAENALIRVAVMTLVQSVPLGYTGLTAGTPIYVDDTGAISSEPGTIVRQIGTVLDNMGAGNYGVWITGTGTFGTVQSISAVPPLFVGASPIAPQLTLSYIGGLTTDGANLMLTDTGVVAGDYGAASVEPESLMPMFTVDANGRLTAASAASITIGGDPAKTYVDNQDAATLAAAEAYAQTLSFGLSSKVPVHAATTIPLPACTVNGTFQTLTANVHGPLLPVNTDGHDLLVGERLLVKDQVAQANNGIYVLTQKGATSGPSAPWILTRADDANTGPELCGSLVTVNVGNTLAGSTWIFASNPASFVLGTTAVVFSQLNAVPATADTYGTVKLTAGLGGTAALPSLQVGSGYVSGVLPATNGGTGLSTAGAADAFLVGNGTGGWTTRSNFASGAILGGTIAVPEYLRFRANGPYPTTNYLALVQPTGSTNTDTFITLPAGGTHWITPYLWDRYGTLPAQGGNLVISSGEGYTTLPPGDLTLRGGGRIAASVTGGEVRIQGGEGRSAGVMGALVSLDGGIGASGGFAYVRGGTGYQGPGGTAFIQGGTSSGDNKGGLVSISGGTGQAAVEADGGNVTIEGGSGYGGGDVIITPGDGTGADGSVRIRRRTGANTGQVLIDDAFVNGTGTAGQALVSNGAGTPPSWQSVGGDAGPASIGSYRGSSSNSITVTSSDYCVTAFTPTFGSVNTVSLPAAANIETGRIFIIKSRNSAGTVTVDPNGTERIDGSNTSRTLALNDVLRIMRTSSSTTEWIEI